jgi:hypothetical protein
MKRKEYLERAMSEEHMVGFDNSDKISFDDVAINLIESLDMETLTEEQGELVGELFDIIEFENNLNEGELLGDAAKLKRTKPSEKRTHKVFYKKHKSKIKRAAKKYRKSAAGRKHAKLSKRKSKMGRTATGKRITRRT